MKTPFRLDQHPRRAQLPLSEPPAGYFSQLPTRLMARVATPPPQPGGLDWGWIWGWLLRTPVALRTGLASTLLLGTFAAAFWLSSGSGPSANPPVLAPLVGLDAVPREQLMAYLLAPETPVEAADLAASARQLSLARQFLQPSAHELAEALDGQPTEESILL